jgi:hypothetical protein
LEVGVTVLVLYRCRLCGGFDQSDYWRRGYMDALQRVEHVEAALRDAEARVARAVDAFNRYGRHDGGCDYRWSGECTCGLLAYRAALAPDETGGAGG